MKLASLVTVLGLCALSVPVQAQRKVQRASTRTATINALSEVQKALHAAENAQVKLLALRQGADVRVQVARAVQQLSAARDLLRARLGVPNIAALKGVVKKRGARREVAELVGEIDPSKIGPRPDEKKVELAIEKALSWLDTHQDDDGRWDSDGFNKHDPKNDKSDDPGNPTQDVGVTGLAVLAFLGDGNTTQSGPYKKTVLKAVKWLRNQQGENGLFGTNNSHDFIYGHAIAAFAMCEAYGLSKDPALKHSAQMGINYLESHRNPYGVWRYQPRDNDNDSSVTSWCLKAYRAAKDHGLKVNEQAIKIGENYFDEVTDPRTGQCGYTKRGEGSSRHPGDHASRFPIEKGEALTAAGLSTRFILGQNPRRVPVMRKAADRLMRRPPKSKDRGAIDHYYWYHGTAAMYQMGGKHWDVWNRAAGKAILGTQRRGGSVDGSWDGHGVWGSDGGRVYATALLVNSLQVMGYGQLIRGDKKKDK